MLPCSKCGTDTVVVDSRDHGDQIRRRRECRKCGHRQTTYERLELKQGILKEEIDLINEYRKMYPSDTRTDAKIFKSLQEIKNESMSSLIFRRMWQKRR